MTTRQKKQFNEESLLRILGNVPKDLAIGVIIKAEALLELRHPDEIKRLAEIAVDNYLNRWPEKVVDLILNIIPNLKTNLALFIAVVFNKYLRMVPGDVFRFEFESPQVEDIDIITQQDYDRLEAKYNEEHRHGLDMESSISQCVNEMVSRQKYWRQRVDYWRRRQTIPPDPHVASSLSQAFGANQVLDDLIAFARKLYFFKTQF